MFTIENHGTIVLVRPLTSDVREWLVENCAPESWQWYGGALAVEPRYVEALVEGLAQEGWVAQ